MLEEGAYRSAGEIAEREGITRSFVNRLLRLTLLAPEIVEAILQGRQPKGLLRGLIFAPGGHAMTPSHSRKNGRLYRYYVSTDAIRQGYSECALRSVPAAEVEEAVVAQVRHLLQTPEIIARTWAAARNEVQLPEREVVETVTDFAPLWDELFPAEQARIVRLLVGRIDLAPDGMQVRLRAEGLETLVEELQSREAKAA